MALACRSVEIESGRNPSLMIGTATRQAKLAAAVADVEDHAALAALEQSRVGVARGVELATQAGIDVRVDVAGTELLGEELRQRLLRDRRGRSRP